MKKRIVLYKRLSDDLMARLQNHVEVTWVDTTQPDGLARLRDALPGAHGLLGAACAWMPACLTWRRSWKWCPAFRWAWTTTMLPNSAGVA